MDSDAPDDREPTPPPEPAGPVTAESLAFAPGVSLGAGLKAAREHLGLTLDDVIATTKVRGAYLTAIEAMDLDKLPSRPFTVGYVRAYAEALGLDPSRAVAQLRQDAPEERPDLPNPIGVDNDSDPRRGLLIAAGLVILAAIFIWNIAQHALNDRTGPAPSAVVKSAPDAQPVTGYVELGSSLPPPVEATLPKPYLTPGLEKADPAAAAEAEAAAAEALKEAPQVARQFVVRGKIYGSPADQSHLTLQARGNVTLVLRRGPQVVDIATLKDGEAYRAPTPAAGILLDASMPSSVDYYVDGAWRGALKDSTTPLGSLGG